MEVFFCKIILNFENEYQAQEVFNKFTENVNHNTLCMHFSCFTQWNNLCVIFIFNELSKVPPYTENVFNAMRKSFFPPKSICFIWHQKERLVTNLCVSGTKYSEHFPHADHSLSSLVKMKSFYCYLHNNQCYTHYRKLTIYQQKMYQLHGRGQITFV